MTPSWSLWFYSPLPHPINARTHLWESEHLPDIKFYTKELRVDPHNAKYRLETLSPRYKSPLMDFRTMTNHLEYNRKTQTRYTIRVYPPSHVFDPPANAPAAVEDAIVISGERQTTVQDGVVKLGEKEAGDVHPPNSCMTAASEKEKLKLAADVANALKKGKARHTEIDKEVYQPSLLPAPFGKDIAYYRAPKPSSSTSLRMKGRHELGSSATGSEPVVSAEVYKHLVWSDSEDDCDDFVWFSDSISDNDPIRAKITRAAESGLGSQSSYLAPAATGANAFTSQPITPPLTNDIIPPGTTRAPLFDRAQYNDLERIIAAATNSVPAGAEEDDLHQRLLSLLESIKPTPTPSVTSKFTDGRMCAKPPQPAVAPTDAVHIARVELDSDQVNAGGAEPLVKLEATTDEAAASVEGTSDLTTTSAQPGFDLGNFADDVKHAVLTALGQGISAIAAPTIDSGSPAEVFVSTCPSPVLEENPPLEPDTPAMAANSSASSDNLADGILSPNSQKTLKGLYLADLLASPLNTPASFSVLRILEEEDAGLDSSLGLKMLDLARSLRSDGELVERKEKKPEVVKADRTESMLRKVLEKLNDQAGMLNAIAEASGVNLLDEDEDEAEAPLSTVVPPVVPPAEALPPAADPQISASVNETSGGPAATPTSASADIMATLAEVTASLAILTPPAPPLPLAADTASSGPTAPPLPRRLVLRPLPHRDEARPLPSVEDYTSETDGSITPSVSDAATTRAQPGRGSCRSISPQRNGPPRNPFADPPQFGRSYTPTQPTSTAGNLSARLTPSVAGQRPPATDARDRPSGRAFNEAFARYAADQQAFPSAAGAARDAHTAGASASSTLAGSREAFYNNVDSYAGVPAPTYYPPYYNPELTRSLFAPSRFGPGAAQPPFFNIPSRSYYPSNGHANPHHHPYHPSHQSAMFGPAPTHSIFDSHYQPAAGLPDQNQHGAPYMWNQTRESRLSGSSASSFGTRRDDEPARGQTQGSFIPGPRQSCWR